MVREANDIDAAFAGNRLLVAFSSDNRALIAPHGEIVQLEAGARVFDRGARVLASLFPFGPTMISMVVQLSEDRTIEVGSIGREGALGGIVSCGHAPAFSQARVQVPGPALKIAMSGLEDAKQRSPFIANLFCRYSDYLLAQMMQSVACNAFHGMTERAARWLLTAQDRAGDQIQLTQESLAGLLGVQRTSVNAVLATLQDEGLVTARRGAVHIVDRAGLRERACECYDIVERHFTDVIGASGLGRDSEDCG